MSISKFEIKITKEANGDDVDLSQMSLRASKALVELLDAMNKMAEAEENSSEITIAVKQGSATVEIEAPDLVMESIQEKVSAALNNRSLNHVYTQGLDNIRKVIQANGLTYESNITFNNQNIDLVGILTGKSKIRRKAIKKSTKEYDIEFIDGKLIENGGKNPNIHIEVDGNKQKITCTERQARNVNSFLYQSIKISAWVKIGQDNKKEYIFCDNYLNDDLFEEFRDEVKFIIIDEGTEPLKRIYRKFKELFTTNRHEDARKFIRIFTNPLVDNNVQRTVLVATKAFKDNNLYKDLIDTIVENLEIKTGRPIY